MPSNAFTHHLLVHLQDADELLDAQRQLLAGRRGGQWGIGSLNRAVVVMCVSAWEGYVEQVVLESVAAICPTAGSPMGLWRVLESSANSFIKRFNTPDVGNVKKLIQESLGFADVTVAWSWKNCTTAQARLHLTKALKLRHEIAHGVKHRPAIRTRYATGLPKLFQRLGSRTDMAIRDHLITTFGVVSPWPR
jgi:hypothetical protein